MSSSSEPVGTDSHRPALSVVLPTFNQSVRLELTLASLVHQSPAVDDCEVIVVDDGSTDETPAVISRYRALLPLKAANQPNSGRSAARNAGARLATGRTIVFCDGDRVCCPSFLEAHRQAATGFGDDYVAVGEIREAYVTDLRERSTEIAADITSGCARLSRRSRRPYFFAELHKHVVGDGSTIRSPVRWLCFLSGNVSMPRSRFVEAGGFDEDFVQWGFEHFELGYRLAVDGVEFRYIPEAVNYHLAHRRAPDEYSSGIEASAKLLRRKHRRFPTDALVALTQGDLALEAFCAGQGNPGSP
jgi:glycosyltransferase involved in cell wall biosynthesis